MSKTVSISKKPSRKRKASNVDAFVMGEGSSGRVAEERMKRLTIDIPLSLHRRVKAGCASQDMKICDAVRELLEKRFPES